MTLADRAQVVASGADKHGTAGLLGFATFFQKELLEWLRNRRALIVGGAAITFAVIGALLPIIAAASGTATEPGAPALERDPTTNVLLAWSGTTVPIVVILSTMMLMTTERERGTLAWSLTKPLSRSSVLLAKWLAATLAYGFVGVVVPLVMQSVAVTLAYGSPPSLGTVASFAGLYLTVPAFYVALTVAFGTLIHSTAGVAGLAFLVALVPGVVASFVPAVAHLSPTGVGEWTLAVVTGRSAPIGVPIAWAASLVVIAAIAMLVFERQDL